MALKVGELYAELKLDSGDYTKALDASKESLKRMDNALTTSLGTVGSYGKALSGLKASAGSIQSALSSNTQNIEKFRAAISASESALSSAKAGMAAHAKIVDDAKAKHAALSKTLAEAKEAAKVAADSFGKESEDAKDAAKAVEFHSEQVKQSKAALAALTKEHKTYEQAVQTEETALADANRQYEAAVVNQKALEGELATANAQIRKQTSLLNRMAMSAEAASEWQLKLGKTLTTSLTLPLVAGTVAIGKFAVDFESAFAGVEKTVDGTDEELATIRQGIRDMAKEIPTGTTELSALAEAAGQLGIQTPNVLGFTRVMADLKESTNLGDEGATQLARFANITGMSQDNFDRLGSSIVDLGNNYATTESDIVSMAMRLAAAGKQVGMSEADILGFSAALSSVGIEAEAGGSAFSRIMSQIQLAVETNSKKLSQFAKVAGMTGKQFATTFKTDAVTALMAFVKGLNEGDTSATKLLADMDINDVRMTDALKRAAGAGDMFSSAINTANTAWSENTALANEAQKRYKTVASRLKVLGNRAKDVGMSLGEKYVVPALEGGMEAVDGFIKKIDGMTDAQKDAAKTAVVFAAAIGPGFQILGKANQAISNVITGIQGFSEAATAAGGAGKLLVSAIGPAGWIAIGAGILYGAHALYDWASGAKAAREATANMMKIANEWKSTQAKTVFDTGNDPFARFKLTKEDFAGTKEGSKQLTKYETQYAKLLKTINSGKAGKKTKASFGKNVEQTIQLRFELAQGDGGYDKLLSGVEAEIERLKALGMEPTSATYADAMKAAAQGNKETVDSINDAYSEQYAEIQKITDKDQRDAALKQLNAQYQEQMADAAERYAAVIKQLAPGMFETPEVKAGAEQWETLSSYIDDYTSATTEAEKNDALANINKQVGEMDEASLTSFLAAIKDVDNQAQTLKGLNVDPTTIFSTDQLDTATTSIEDFSSAVEFLNSLTGPDADKLAGLKEILSGAEEELGRVSSDLDLTPKVSIAQENVEVPADLTLEALAKFTGFIPPDAAPSLESIAKFVGYTPPEGEEINLDALAKFVGYTPPAGEDITLDALANFVKYTPPAAPPTLSALAQFVGYEPKDKNEIPSLESIAKFVGYTPPAGEDITLDALAAFVKYTPPATQPALSALAQFVGYTPADKNEIPTLESIAKFVGYTPPAEKPEIEVTAKITFNPKTFALSSSNLEEKPGILGIGASDTDQINNIVKAYEALKELQFSGGGAGNGDAMLDTISRIETFLGTADLDSIKTFVEQYKALLDSGGTPSESQTAQMQSLANLLQVINGIGMQGDGVTGLTDALDDIFNADWSTSLDPAVEALQGLVDKATEAGTNTAIGYANGIASNTDPAKTAGGNLGGAGLDGLNTTLDSGSPSRETYKIGGWFAEGMANGIKDSTYLITAAARAAAKAAMDAIKNALGISSPSKVAFQFGGYFTEGFADGIESMERSVSRASRGMAAMATRGLMYSPVRIPALAGAAAGPIGGLSIDYNRLASALAAHPTVLRLNDKELARATVEPNAAAEARRQARIRAGYGG